MEYKVVQKNYFIGRFYLKVRITMNKYYLIFVVNNIFCSTAVSILSFFYNQVPFPACGVTYKTYMYIFKESLLWFNRKEGNILNEKQISLKIPIHSKCIFKKSWFNKNLINVCKNLKNPSWHVIRKWRMKQMENKNLEQAIKNSSPCFILN